MVKVRRSISTRLMDIQESWSSLGTVCSLGVKLKARGRNNSLRLELPQVGVGARDVKQHAAARPVPPVTVSLHDHRAPQVPSGVTQVAASLQPPPTRQGARWRWRRCFTSAVEQICMMPGSFDEIVQGMTECSCLREHQGLTSAPQRL
ncbi:hypothetical protein O3P69_002422 [Scylla paramamosain]|uniref:Uncharacterized protein n=1 Tax=Scylla paramamosain TaxID=85552 RepID=A0AAW0V6A4_SCYPA